SSNGIGICHRYRNVAATICRTRFPHSTLLISRPTARRSAISKACSPSQYLALRHRLHGLAPLRGPGPEEPKLRLLTRSWNGNYKFAVFLSDETLALLLEEPSAFLVSTLIFRTV